MISTYFSDCMMIFVSLEEMCICILKNKDVNLYLKKCIFIFSILNFHHFRQFLQLHTKSNRYYSHQEHVFRVVHEVCPPPPDFFFVIAFKNTKKKNFNILIFVELVKKDSAQKIIP